MAKTTSRLDKISDQVKRELAQLIQNEVRDPRVGMVSITDVKVSRDLSYATVYITVMGKTDGKDAAESLEALGKASGYLRSLLAKSINLRTTPRLTFSYDESIARGAYLSGLIDEALARDQRNSDKD
jgi:ribosome-binding factor A